VRPLRAWLLYLAAVMLGGALLAPWLHALVQTAAEKLPWMVPLARSPFPRFVNRAVLFLALVGLWPLLRGLRVRSRSEVGLGSPAGHWPQMLGGLALGFGTLAAVALLAIGGGVRRLEWDLAGGRLLEHLANAGLAAVCVSLVEEVLFRGALFGTLRQAVGVPTALAISSLVYAWVHLLAPVKWSAGVHWWSGLAVLAGMLHGLIEFKTMVPGFLNLVLAGVILGLAYQRSGALYLSLGLHAGWVFWLKSYRFLTCQLAGPGAWLWGTDKLIDGWLAFGALTLALGVLLRWQPPARSRAELSPR
jgi:hypothetical protein